MLTEKLSSFQPCPGGLLICPIDKAETDWCDCDNPQAVFNVEKYALSNASSTPLERLVIHPPLPSGFIHFTTDCCSEAARCCREVLRKDDRSKGAAFGTLSRFFTKVKEQFCSQANIVYSKIHLFYSYEGTIAAALLKAATYYANLSAERL